MLSPRDSHITSKPDAGTDDTVPDDALELSGSSMKTLVVTMCLSQMISRGAQLGRSGTVSHVGVDLLLWYRSRTMSVLDDCNVIHVFV